MGKVTVNEIKYSNFGKCIEVSNGEVSLVVTVDFGPRIIRYGFVDGKNELCENSDVTLDSQYGEWK
ncbi:MAG: hypothetical protein Q8942_07860, partial [Bacillota bacterium]|nr:hypothetical protein [Bacillota bacterium]